MRCSRRGNMAVTVALSLTSLLGVSALAIDLGYVRAVQNKLQMVADASAHAASAQLDGTEEGIVRARAMARWMAERNAVAGHAATVEEDDVTLGYWDPFARTFTETDDPMWANTARVNAEIPELGLLFAPIAMGKASMPVRARSAMAASQGGAGAVDCYVPIAVPSCLVELHTLEGLQDVTLHLNPAGVDSMGWGRTNGAISAAFTRSQIRNCYEDGWAFVGHSMNLQNGVVTTAMDELVAALRASETRWDVEKWGTQPARLSGSSIPAVDYGKTFEGPILVFESGPTYCQGSGGSFNGTETIQGFMWGAVYDIRNTGAAEDRTVHMRLDTQNEHDVGALMGGPNYGVTTFDLPRMVE